ncbi:Hybrid PKS-NRPS synthetase lepA [Colletotrichum siamense]|uniref:Hybrid PKS-NRPS synthetase lepA n=1 Tax=Colletotrichum siamense TaxID=690259 RepID=A0A9P5EY94_COLSI|nr:Hybrid PKS-NRPS synthetase lepA [Colletotrichum siamense]KAF4861908.1 Hybrid PKS-NRPS synthetase lepA [Colletotrichum siamense]
MDADVEIISSQLGGTFHIHSTRDTFLGQDQPLIANGLGFKTRLLGQSHWAIRDIFSTLGQYEGTPDTNWAGIGRCKSLARYIKARRTPAWPPPPNSKLPSKEVADTLLDNYLRTTESMYRILHLPTFRRQYEALWVNDTVPDPGFLERVGVAGDSAWVLSGTILRKAMHMGLHRDPSHLPGRSAYEAEMRRRLWNTVLEVNLQASLSSGGAPLISMSDFDTAPPGNFDEEQLEADGPTPRPPSTFTQVSVAIALRQTFPQRLAVVSFLNGLRVSPGTYEYTLRIDTELREAFKRLSRILRIAFSSSSSQAQNAKSEVQLVDFYMQRYLISLHAPYFGPAHGTAYIYSQKTVVESSLRIWRAACPPPALASNGLQKPGVGETESDLPRLASCSSGFYQTATFHAALLIALDLRSQLQEEEEYSLLGPKPLRPDLMSVMEEARMWCLRVIKAGETNVKGYLLINLVAAQIRSMMRLMKKDEVAGELIKAVKGVEETCLPILEGMAEEVGMDAAGAETIDGILGQLPEPMELWQGMEDWAFNDDMKSGDFGVSVRGYLGLPHETQKKFISDSDTGDVLYRTGDSGRLLSDGTLFCLGRLGGDTQIKLRGLRLELEEVEAALLQASEGLLSSVVVFRRGDIFVAHATVSPNLYIETALTDSEINTILRLLHGRLPQYFIPAAIVTMADLLTNPNCKVDCKAVARLPLSDTDPAQAESGNEKEEEASMNLREGELRLLWEKVLPSAASSTMGRIIPFARHDKNIQREAEIPDWLKERVQGMSKESEKSQPEKSKGLNGVLTGADGFLGGRVLQALLQTPAVQTVNCIALEDEQEGNGSSHGDIHKTIEANPSKTVNTFGGSLADPKLGLTPSGASCLRDTADIIIHAGSSGHCLNNYAALKAPNVSATHRLAALALPRSVPLLFICSNRVPLLAGNTEQVPCSMAKWMPARDGREGLTATKWVGEVFLESLNKLVTNQTEKAWAVEVHRPCIVVGDQAPNSDSMNAILRYSLQMKCAPLVTRGQGYIDFKPVDDVAMGIVESALIMAQRRTAGVSFKHHSSRVKVPVDKFREHLEQDYEGKFESVEMKDWVAKAGNAGIDPLITAYLNGILESDEEMVFPYLGA